jgi:hypothetical protein
MNEIYLQIELAKMSNATAMINHYNLCAAREENLGGWKMDWQEAIKEEVIKYNDAKFNLEEYQKL